jgi:hypothetical protein
MPLTTLVMAIAVVVVIVALIARMLAPLMTVVIRIAAAAHALLCDLSRARHERAIVVAGLSRRREAQQGCQGAQNDGFPHGPFSCFRAGRLFGQDGGDHARFTLTAAC